MSKIKDINGKNYDCFPLTWDKDYFKVDSARVNLSGPVNYEGQEEILSFAKDYDFVTLVNLGNLKENNHWIGENTRAFLADVNIQFVKTLQDRSKVEDDNTGVENNLSFNQEILDISKESFKYSRFFNDPKLPRKEAENIYLHWAECAFDQEDKYFVISKRQGRIAGYILFSIDGQESTIELIAVDKEYQGQRVGKSLINKMETFLLDKAINKIKVGTQVNNISAAQFYLKMGFIYVGCGSMYHMWTR